MSLPRFFSRVADAVGPVAAIDPDTLAHHLTGHTITIQAPARCTDDAGAAAGATLAVNLAARLYPRLQVTGPREWSEVAGQLATSINPAIDLSIARTSAYGNETVTLRWHDQHAPAADAGARVVTVAAEGWNVHVDAANPPSNAAHPLTELAAASVGIAEVFRVVFADLLPDHGRRSRQPGGFNLITAAGPSSQVPVATERVLPDAHLVGSGAVGQACLLALLTASVQMRLTVVDPQTVELSNLQRYLLTTDGDVGEAKTGLAAHAAAGSAVTVVEVPTVWGADLRSGPGVAQALTALDSAADRIGVAASLPGRIYNAWTQPADVGWSRHETFGVEPCLACLYYPDRPRLHEYQVIASALGQPPLRVLSYLITRQPVGAPLPMVLSVPDLPVPPDAQTWVQRSLLADLIDAGHLDTAGTALWAGQPIGQLYRDGICAGGIVRPTGNADAALVPLAHQSALAGIMLATQFLAGNTDQLRPWRPAAIEARIDLLRGMPQILARPRNRTPRCLCTDPLFQAGVADR